MKRLFFLLPLLFGVSLLSAQVGINNPAPSQALDVGGKIKVGDDGIAPEAGTIRYNRVTGTFEGYDGSVWSVFNPNENDNGTSVPPSGSLVAGRRTLSPSVTGSDSRKTIIWRTASGQSFFEIPAGRTLYVTSVIITSTSGARVELYPENAAGQEIETWGLTFDFNQAVEGKQFTEANGSLISINSGGQLWVDRTGAPFVTFFLRGYLL